MDNYDDQIKPLILRLKFDIKLREFVSFILLRHKNLLCLGNWIEMLQKHPKYTDEKRFLDFFKYITKIPNDHTKIELDIFLTNVFIVIKDWEVTDDLLLDMLKFIDINNYV